MRIAPSGARLPVGGIDSRRAPRIAPRQPVGVRPGDAPQSAPKSASLPGQLGPSADLSGLPRSHGELPTGLRALNAIAGHPWSVAAVLLATGVGIVAPAQAADRADLATPTDAAPLVKGSMVSAGRLTLSETTIARALDDEGQVGATRLRLWSELVNSDSNRALTEKDKVELVNRFVNEKVQYTRESFDFWNGPIGTLSSGAGDCEDFALAKYATLRLLGVPADHLSIAVGRTKSTQEAHAVLFWRAPGQPLRILDNRHSRAETESQADFGTKMYQFNEGTAHYYKNGNRLEIPQLLRTGKISGALARMAPVLPP